MEPCDNAALVVADIYTDGSCVDENMKRKRSAAASPSQRVAGSGVFWDFCSSFSERNEKFETEYSERVPEQYNQTNQAAELYAVLMALRQIKRFRDKELLSSPPHTTMTFRILSDSQYTIKSLTLWYKNWEKNGYKNSRGDPVCNQELIKTILAELKTLRHGDERIEVLFAHVKGHSNNKGNDTADRLACRASSSSNVSES